MNEAKEILIGLIKEFEGCELTAYRCPAKKLTIGYGQTKGVEEGMEWTQQQAEEDLDATVKVIMDNALKASITLQNATPNRIAAVCDFIYNCGVTNYKKSTLKKYVDWGQWEHARMEIIKWNKAGGRVLKGLVRRRQAEAELLKS